MDKIKSKLKLKTKKNKDSETTNISSHPSHLAHLKRMNRVIGQLQGIKRMIEERRYCPEILVQTRAASAALRSIEVAILETHVGHCVNDAFESRSLNESSEKIRELVELIKRF